MENFSVIKWKMLMIHAMVWMYFRYYPEWKNTGNSRSGEWPDPLVNSPLSANWCMLVEITSASTWSWGERCRGKRLQRKIKNWVVAALIVIGGWFFWLLLLYKCRYMSNLQTLCFKHVHCTVQWHLHKVTFRSTDTCS